jgi:hypothetical protein
MVILAPLEVEALVVGWQLSALKANISSASVSVK